MPDCRGLGESRIYSKRAKKSASTGFVPQSGITERMWPRITRNWTMATMNHKLDPYCLLLARSTNYKPDRCCLRLVRSTYSHPWFVVLMFSPIFLPRILHYIEFVYVHCYSRRLRIQIQVCVSRRLRLYYNMTNEDLTFTRDFNRPARVRVQANVT